MDTITFSTPAPDLPATPAATDAEAVPEISWSDTSAATVAFMPALMFSLSSDLVCATVLSTMTFTVPPAATLPPAFTAALPEMAIRS